MCPRPVAGCGQEEGRVSARIVFIFGLYVVVAALVMMLVPGQVLEVLGVVITGEPWVHLAGYLAVMIGVYFLVAARVEAETFFGVAVPLRQVSAVVLFGKAVLCGCGAIAIFAVPDVAGGLWTWSARRRPADVATG